MALLNPPETLPNVARILYRTLRAADGFRSQREALATAVAPPALRRADDDSGAGSRAFEHTLRACVEVRLLEQVDDVVSLHPDLPDESRNRRRSDDHLPSLMRSLILSDALNHGLWDSTEGSRDLTRALCWFMCQDPLRPPGRWLDSDGPQALQNRDFPAGARVFSNDTRWGAFDRWVPFLGFGYHLIRDGREVLVPDPTAVLRGVLPELLTHARQEVGLVLELLASAVPVMDGGVYRRAVEERMRPASVPGADDQLSPSVAHALLVLRDRQLIVLEDLADAPNKIRLPDGFGPERTISHISLPAKPPRASRP